MLNQENKFAKIAEALEVVKNFKSEELKGGFQSLDNESIKNDDEEIVVNFICW